MPCDQKKVIEEEGKSEVAEREERLELTSLLSKGNKEGARDKRTLGEIRERREILRAEILELTRLLSEGNKEGARDKRTLEEIREGCRMSREERLELTSLLSEGGTEGYRDKRTRGEIREGRDMIREERLELTSLLSEGSTEGYRDKRTLGEIREGRDMIREERLELTRRQFQRNIEREKRRLRSEREGRLKPARLLSESELQSELARLRKENIKGTRYSLIVEDFADFNDLLSTCERGEFDDYPDDFITNYIDGRRDSRTFVQKTSESKTSSEITAIKSEGGTKMPKIIATAFDVKSTDISLRSAVVDFAKLGSFNAKNWFKDGGYDDFLAQQIGYLNVLRRMFYNLCAVLSIPEKKIQRMVELFCEQFVQELRSTMIHVLDARKLELSCDILINGVMSCLVGYSDIFLTESPDLCVSKKLTAMLKLKPPTTLRGVDWFPVRCQMIAQLLMLQGMLTEEAAEWGDAEIGTETELPEHADTDDGEHRKDCESCEGDSAGQYMAKAAVFDGFCMEVFFAVDDLAQKSFNSSASFTSRTAGAPTIFMTQRVSEASECINLFLFLLWDVSIADLNEVTESIAETAIESGILPNESEYAVNVERVRTAPNYATPSSGNLKSRSMTAKSSKADNDKRPRLGELTAFHLNMPSRIGARPDSPSWRNFSSTPVNPATTQLNDDYSNVGS